jgi:hypothetical protein
LQLGHDGNALVVGEFQDLCVTEVPTTDSFVIGEERAFFTQSRDGTPVKLLSYH